MSHQYSENVRGRRCTSMSEPGTSYREEQGYGGDYEQEHGHEHRYECANPQKRRKLQGWLEWRAASMRSNDLRVGDDGVVRPVSELGRERGNERGREGKGDSHGFGVESRGRDSSSTGNVTYTEDHEVPWTQATWHSSLPPRPTQRSSERAAQKRKLSWDGSDRGAARPEIGDLCAGARVSSGRSPSVSSQEDVLRARDKCTDLYGNIHPSRLRRIDFDEGAASPKNGDNLEGRRRQQQQQRQVTSDNEKMGDHDDVDDEGGSKVVTETYRTNAYRRQFLSSSQHASSCFDARVRPRSYRNPGPYGADNCVDVTARESSLRQREVLLEISERSVLGAKTQVMQVSRPCLLP